MKEFKVGIKQAFEMFYGTKTYEWFSDEKDRYMVAREGGTALTERVVLELRDGTLL
jgi:hypothetical protein